MKIFYYDSIMRTALELVYIPKIEPIYACSCGNTFCSNIFL